MSSYSPREIVSELDRYIIGQTQAKRAVAIALRNRWRRLQLSEELREEILPKNILMIGSTGVGKTEIVKRMAKLTQAPFLKVEATKFTEIGYVGRDVEQIIRDLIEIAIALMRKKMHKEVAARAELNAEERVLNALVGENATQETRQKFRHNLREGLLNDKEIEIQVSDTNSSPLSMFEIPGMPGSHMEMVNLSDLFNKSMESKSKTRRMTVRESYDILISEECDKLIDRDKVTSSAINEVEQNGIVFIDEIDKISSRSDFRGSGGDVSREGVQRDLLPLIEGTSVQTKHGAIKTDHILFIASGSFHQSKPSDLLPELQGRLPIRVELKPLNADDFKRILTEIETSLIKQSQALLSTEKVDLRFSEDSLDEIARLAAEINSTIENIGARRLHTVIERLLEEISFNASEQEGSTVLIDAEYVRKRVSDLLKDVDLSRFIL